MVHLKEEITKKRPQMKKKKVLVHQDNAPCHKLSAMMAKLHELQFELLLDPHYSPGWLFGFYGVSTFVGYLTPNSVYMIIHSTKYFLVNT